MLYNVVPQATVSRDSVQISTIDATTYRIVWSEKDCLLYNGDLVGYTVDISNGNATITINTTTTEVVTSDLAAGVQYSISIAAINVVGVGPYSDAVVFVATSTDGKSCSAGTM